MPDFVCPYKHYSVFDIELALIDMEAGIRPDDVDCSADASTIRRWHTSFKSKAQRLMAGFQAILATHFDRTVSEVSEVAKTSFARLATILNKFPAFESSDFHFSRANLILSNFVHTHTLHGLADTSVVKIWTYP